MYWLDYVTYLMSQISFYFIIVLSNVILIIVLLYGTSLVNVTRIKLKSFKKKNYDLLSSYKLLLENFNKHPLYVVRIRKFMEAIYKI